MKTTRFSLLFALTTLVALSVSAQPSSPWVGPLVPAEPTTSDRVTLDFMVSTSPHNLCDLMLPGEVEVSREDGVIDIQYTLRKRTEADPAPEYAGCLGTYIPIDVTADLGFLPAGDYVTSITTTVAGVSGTYPPEHSMAFVVGGDAAAPWMAGVPEVTPPNPTTDDVVRLLITDGAATNGCNLTMPEPISVQRNGRTISIEYAFVSIEEVEAPPGTLCLSAHFPAFLWAELGRLPVGTYEVTVNGSFDGAPRAPQQTAFIVGAVDAVSFIPVNRPLALALMLLALGGVAVWRLRAR